MLNVDCMGFIATRSACDLGLEVCSPRRGGWPLSMFVDPSAGFFYNFQ